MSGMLFAQNPPPATPAPKAKPMPKGKVYTPKPPTEAPPPFAYREGVTSEKAVAADKNVNIKLCVFEGRLKINGWNHDEVRIFVKNGSRFGVKVLEKDPKSMKPVWILLLGDPKTRIPGQSPECISGETVEIDVPVGASLSISGHNTQTSVDSVKKIEFKNIEGGVAFRNIAGGIVASTYRGDLTVENSGGAISLESGEGNIVAYEVNPGQIGDLFKVKTNSGSISLQKLEHRQIVANSISGTLLFNGKFLSGGQYNFKTSNGSIRLMLPADSSCSVQATYGYGTFNSEIPLKYLTENVTPVSKTIAATMGSGEACNVNLITSTGTIGIKKQQ